MPAKFPRSYAEAPPNPVGGALALDLVNTVEWRGDPAMAGERLVDYGELAHWAGHVGAVALEAVPTLLAIAARRPDDAARTLAEARALRETVARLLTEPQAATADDVCRLNAHLGNGASRLAAVAGGFAWTAAAGDPLAEPLARVARDAAELLTSSRLDRVRRCADARCGWLFLDADRGPGRRWCSMADCGNRAKARRHYRRRRSTPESPVDVDSGSV